MTSVNLLQIELNHVLESYISQLCDNVQVKQNMKVLLLNYVALKSKELFTKKINKFGKKFSERENETNSLVNNLQTLN